MADLRTPRHRRFRVMLTPGEFPAGPTRSIGGLMWPKPKPSAQRVNPPPHSLLRGPPAFIGPSLGVQGRRRSIRGKRQGDIRLRLGPVGKIPHSNLERVAPRRQR